MKAELMSERDRSAALQIALNTAVSDKVDLSSILGVSAGAGVEGDGSFLVRRQSKDGDGGAGTGAGSRGPRRSAARPPLPPSSQRSLEQRLSSGGSSGPPSPTGCACLRRFSVSSRRSVVMRVRPSRTTMIWAKTFSSAFLPMPHTPITPPPLPLPLAAIGLAGVLTAAGPQRVGAAGAALAGSPPLARTAGALRPRKAPQSSTSQARPAAKLPRSTPRCAQGYHKLKLSDGLELSAQSLQTHLFSRILLRQAAEGT